MRYLRFIFLLAMLGCASLAHAKTLYIAPDGRDSWTGERMAASGNDGPLASLTGARNRIRQIKAEWGEVLREPVRVIIRKGTYSITEPLVLEPQDSGTKECPIVYAAENPKRKPVISGGRRIAGWRKAGNLWVAELPQVRAGQWYFGALWVNGQRRTRARMPDKGYFFTAGKAPALKDPATGQETSRESSAFRFKPGDIKNWKRPDAQVVVYHSWETSIHHIASVDEAGRIVTFTGPAAWPFEYWGPNQRYHVENLPEALDKPGEWYLNRASGRLTYIPFPGEDLVKAEVIAPVARQLVLLEGKPAESRFVEYVRFENLNFRHTDWPIPPQGHSDGQAAFSVPGAVQGIGARSSAVVGCEIAHVGTYGLWWRAGSQDCLAQKCDIHDLGAGGIRLGEGGDPASENEAAMRNTVDNCFIHDGSKIFRGAVGVWVGRSSYNTLSHNEICDFDYTGVSIGWSWGYAPSSANHNVLEYNHIHDIGRGVLNDMGAVYTLGISSGTVERNNLIHDIYCYIFGGWGVYTDEGSTDILIENNIVYNTSSGCFHQHYGKDNLLRNNVFAFGLEGVLRRSRIEEHNSFTFQGNIVLSRGTGFHIVNWEDGHYTIDRNLYWDYANPSPTFFGLSFDEWKSKGRDRNSLVADPLMVNALRYDFRLKPGSPASQVGFTPIDISRIGLYGDPEWVRLPKTAKRVRYVPPRPRPARPLNVQEGFENTAPGEKAGVAATYEEGSATVRVTEEAAATGKRSLKFSDMPGLAFRFNPHLAYFPSYEQGTAVVSFDLRAEPGAVLYHEWRDAYQPYRVGPSIRLEEGALKAGNKELARIPDNRWVHLEIRSALGQMAAGTWDIAITLPGSRSPLTYRSLPGNPTFQRLQWVGFVADGDRQAAFYVDNVRVRAVK
ncbi:MAG: right-handed parallel beta-helix repeat-containing protein [Armatimonadetes bacterium]|nr:right-handed parallel beta-helix repeat-containing protein [Armatimonadota bacterium]